MTPDHAYCICLQEKQRKNELEPIILTDPGRSFLYALNVIKGIWSEAESRILTNAFYSYLYARDIIKDRWTEAESLIRQDNYSAYLYATNVIKGRWPEAEPFLRQNGFYWEEYCQYFNIKKEKTNWKIGL